jgi:hypothetical protein
MGILRCDHNNKEASMRLHCSAPRLGLLAALLAANLLAASAQAQSPPAAIRACRGEGNDAERLRCYDREVDRWPLPAAAPAAPAVASAPAMTKPLAPAAAPTVATTAAATTAAATVAPTAAPAPKAGSTDAKVPASRSVNVTAITLRKDRTFIATFDNGETWEQWPGDKPVPLVVGSKVQLVRLLLGTYQLVGPRHYWTTQVRQTKEP